MSEHSTGADRSPTDAGATRLRVEDLSARTGAPVRTIREYQTWRILHPPTREGRVGWYDESHVRRLATIARLQERGYSIAAIRDLFGAWEQGVGLRDVLGLDDTAGIPVDEVPVWLTADQFDELLPALAESPRLRARAVRIGLATDDHGGYLARSPALLQLTADAMRAMTASAALDVAEAIIAAADAAGRATAVAVAGARSADPDALERLLRRGRGLLARAVASHTIDRVGHHLAEDAADDPVLRALLDQIRIGTVHVTP